MRSSRGRSLAAMLIGIVFFVAGFLKIQDPVGAGLVVGEYLEFFHLGWFAGISKVIGLGMALLETVCGIALISGVLRKASAVLAILLTIFFTIVTIILVIFNPVMDCGCFGEAIHLSHAQTLLKNLLLCVLCAVAFLPLEKIVEGKGWIRPIVAILATLSIFAFALYSLNNIPSVDFMAFKPGVTLRPAGTTGNQDDVADLPVRDINGMYADDALCESDIVIFSVYDDMDIDGWMDLSNAVADSRSAGFQAYVLMPELSMAPLELEDISLAADRKTLLSLNRSNGGATWLRDGTIIRKWAFNGLPDVLGWEAVINSDPDMERMDFVRHGRIRFQTFMFYPLVMLLF